MPPHTFLRKGLLNLVFYDGLIVYDQVVVGRGGGGQYSGKAKGWGGREGGRGHKCLYRVVTRCVYDIN